MNPFDLRGPEFLLVYGIVAAFVITIAFRIRLWSEDLRTKPLPKIEDPYLIAYLRGGSEAAIEAAVVSLVDRQRLSVEKKKVYPKSGTNITHPLERAVWKKIRPSTPATAIRHIRCEEEMAGYKDFLLRHSLIPNPQQKLHRYCLMLASAFVLMAFGGTKIYIAIQRGRTNIEFLVILMIISLIATFLNNPRLTARGTRALQQLTTLLTNLKDRAGKLKPNQNTQELVLLTALFGVMAVPTTAMPLRTSFYPQTVTTSSGDGGGSSCGSSCGSGCGGGGGCGGCGS